jgi:flagellar hook-length control protein FliK
VAPAVAVAAPVVAEAAPEADQLAAIAAAAGGKTVETPVKAAPQGDAKPAGQTAATPAADGTPAVTPIEAGQGDGSDANKEQAGKQHAPAIAEAAKPAVDTAARIPDAAGAVKASAEAIHNLGLHTPVNHTAAASAATAVATPAATTAAATVPVAGLAVEIVSQAQIGRHRFEIRLDPPELGRIDVRLDVDKDGNVSSRLTVERPETLDLLRRDAQQLERALQQAGLKTGDNALEFSLRDQNFGRDERNAQNPSRQLSPDEEPAPLEAVRRYGIAGMGGGLDIRV